MHPYFLLRYHIRRRRIYPARYAHVFECVERARPRRLLEIGVFRGQRALQMIETARIWQAARDIDYVGFDLFEEYSPDKYQSELSDPPLSLQAIQDKLAATGAQVELVKGDSTVTVPAFARSGRRVDFCYIDGGHSFATIEADWNNVKDLVDPGGVVVFDDYYHNPEMTAQSYGCQQLMDQLRAAGRRVEVFPTTDTFRKDWGTLKISIAAVWF